MILSILSLLAVLVFWAGVAYWLIQLGKYDYKQLPDNIEHCLLEIEDITECYAFHDRVCELTDQIRKLQEKENDL